MSSRVGTGAEGGWLTRLRGVLPSGARGPAVHVSTEDIEAAWGRVVNDCGCPDRYFCPAATEIECPRHGGFDVCCDRPGDHVPVAR